MSEIRLYVIDDRTRARVGYEDGHVEIDVDLPFPLSVIKTTATRILSPEAILAALPAVADALDVIDAKS